jgi:hypothetical protein
MNAATQHKCCNAQNLNYIGFMSTGKRKAMSSTLTTNAFESVQTQFTALTSKAVDVSEQNTKSVFAFAREALAAKTPEAFFKAQQEFFKSQQAFAAKQAEELYAFYAECIKQAPVPFADAFKPFMPSKAA